MKLWMLHHKDQGLSTEFATKEDVKEVDLIINKEGSIECE